MFEPFSPQKCVLVQKRHIIVSLSFEVYNEERVQRKVLLLLLLMAEQGPKSRRRAKFVELHAVTGCVFIMLCWCSSCSDDWILKPILKIAEHKLSLSLSLSLSPMMMMIDANVPSRRVRLCVLLLLLSFALASRLVVDIYIYIDAL